MGAVSVYGQESNHAAWRLAAMNIAIRGIDFNFGKRPANTFLNDQHPGLRADFVMAVPPFGIREWRDGRLKGDPRWVYGTPPKGNANFAWVQHMLYHLAPHGSMALLLANGSMSSNTKVEGKIRRALVEADLVECMLALPGQLFTNTQNPACVWFLTKNKKGRDASPSRPPVRNRTGEVLFIDARQLGYMRNRVLRDFTPANLEKIAGTFRIWKYDSKLTRSRGKRGEEKLSTSSLRVSAPPRETSTYSDIPGFCKSAKT
jgi:type I restriction enzyme M protein